MSGATRERLTDTFLRTLEEAAFTFAEPTPTPPPFSGELLEARIEWGRSELRAVVERRFAATLAASLLGEDEPDDARAADALGELLNMAAGALAHALPGGAGSSLGLPSVRALDAGDWAAHDGAQCSVSLLEERGSRIELTLEGAAAGAAR